MILTICITTDIGGYVFGKTFKGPKLVNISPNKTYSGVVGGFLTSIIAAYLLDSNFNSYFQESQNFFDDLYFILAVFLVSSVSQIGDLIISFFKRASNIKDTGNIFPGHGGLLDRLDGLMLSSLILYIGCILYV